MKSTRALLALLLTMPVTAYCQDTIAPKPPAKILQEATITGHTPPVQHKKDRTIINVDASPTNTGSTVLEVLERSPGVTVDRNGASEYFKIKRDSRVVALSFTYRFGRTFKAVHHENGATEEADRVQNS